MNWIHSVYVYFRVGHSNPPEYFNYVDYDTWEGKGKTEVEGKEEAVSKVTMEELAGIAHEGKVRICVISDTHERHTSLTIPPCDILIHCGDITFASRFKTPSCRLQILHSFGQWLSAQKQCTYKVVVGGNHDKGLEESDEDTILRALSGSSTPRRSEEQIQAQAQAHAQGVIYLNNEYVTVEGLGIFGSPYSKGKSGNAAFQSKAQAEESMLKFAQVLEMSAGAGAGPGPGPADTKRKPLDVLVCHSNSLEPVLDAAGRSGEVELPKLSLWGHYHAKYGVRRSKEQKQNSKSPMQASTGASAKYRSMMSVCACSVNEAYNPVNSPIIIDVPRPTR